MRATIDRSGRLVVPKPLRAQVGLEAGGEVEVSVRDGRIEIEPVYAELRLVERGARFVFDDEIGLSVLTAEDVREIVERLRR